MLWKAEQRVRAALQSTLFLWKCTCTPTVPMRVVRDAAATASHATRSSPRGSQARSMPRAATHSRAQ
eukprot:3188175-Pleurochrysis_carterae.AAC.3